MLERASARESAARVAAGALAKLLLRALGVEVASHVIRVGKAELVAAGDVGGDCCAGSPRRGAAELRRCGERGRDEG